MEESIKAERMNLAETEPAMYSPLVLAYLGDAVYELMIRSKVVRQGNTQVNKMHKKSAYGKEGNTGG